MNKLTNEQRCAVVRCLVDGCSIRATVRITGVAKNTIQKLTRELGEACLEYQHQVFRNLKCKRVECDVVRNARLHRWRRAERLVNPHKVMVHEHDGDAVGQHIGFLTERTNDYYCHFSVDDRVLDYCCGDFGNSWKFTI